MYIYIYNNEYINLVNELINNYKEMKYQFNILQQQQQQQQSHIPSDADNFINKTTEPQTSDRYDNNNENNNNDDDLTFVSTDLFEDNTEPYYEYNTPIKSKNNNYNNDNDWMNSYQNHNHHKHKHIHRYNCTKEKKPKISINIFIIIIS